MQPRQPSRGTYRRPADDSWCDDRGWCSEGARIDRGPDRGPETSGSRERETSRKRESQSAGDESATSAPAARTARLRTPEFRGFSPVRIEPALHNAPPRSPASPLLPRPKSPGGCRVPWAGRVIHLRKWGGSATAPAPLDAWPLPAYKCLVMSASLLLCPSLHLAREDGVRQVVALRQQHTLAPIYVLLPRAEAIQSWQQRLGDCVNVHLVQFRSLAEAVLRQAHLSPRRLHTDEQLQIVAEVLADLRDVGALPTFGPVSSRPGMAKALLDWLREMQSQGISPQWMTRHAQATGSRRDAQLAAVYRGYARALRAAHSADAEGLVRRAVWLLERDATLFSRVPLLLVAGFDQLSPLQLALLGRLGRRVGRCIVYLTWDESQAQDASSLALSRLWRTRSDLERSLAAASSTMADDSGADPGLASLVRRLFMPAPAITAPTSTAIAAVEAPSREDEVRWALREAKRLLLAGARPDGIAILAPRPDAYERTVAAVAAEYGVPVRQELLLAENPAVATVLAVLALAPGFPRRETIDALRSPYVEQPWLTADQVALLDRLTRERPVLAGVDQWLHALRATPAEVDDDDESAKAPLAHQPPAQELAQLEAGLTAFFAHLQPPATGTRAEHTKWLQERVLGIFADPDLEPDDTGAPPSLHIARRCEQAPYRQRDHDALARLLMVLRRLALHHWQRSDAITWEQYRTELAARVAVARVPADGGLQSLCFDSLELARHVSFEHLFVLGLSEGEFPGPPAADVFYSEEERRHSPLPLVQHDPVGDACLWWQAIANTRRTLTLLRPRFDERGAPWPPSPYWGAVVSAAGLGERVLSLPIASLPTLEDAASERELAVALASSGAARVPEALADAIAATRAAHDVWRTRHGWQELGPFDGVLADAGLRRALTERFGKDHLWSLSRLSRYAACPFSFYAEQVLGLEPLKEPEAGTGALVRGSILHAILEVTYRQAAIAGVAPCPETEAQMLHFLDLACQQVLAAAPDRFGFRPTTLWRHEQQELRRSLASLIRSECEESGAEPRFRPYRQEVRFGSSHSQSPPLLLSDDAGSLLLSGIIDRVDVDKDGWLRVIDYKSGSSTISEADIEAGTALQSALYPLAAERLFPGSRVAVSYYLHIPSRTQSGRMVFGEGRTGGEVARQAAAKAVALAAGVRSGHFPVATSASACDRCDFAPLCRADRIARARARRSAAG